MIELRGAQGLYIPSQSLQNRAIAYSSCYENFGVIIEEHLRVQGKTKSSVVRGFSMQPLPLQRSYTIDRTSVGYCSLDLVSCKFVGKGFEIINDQAFTRNKVKNIDQF
jgi:hypothetical protein